MKSNIFTLPSHVEGVRLGFLIGGALTLQEDANPIFISDKLDEIIENFLLYIEGGIPGTPFRSSTDMITMFTPNTLSSR